jgi:hypothetical protein
MASKFRVPYRAELVDLCFGWSIGFTNSDTNSELAELAGSKKESG